MEFRENFGLPSNVKLVDMYNMMKSGELILHPDFQRNLVWNDAHKENFLETILCGYPFPEIYIADGELDIETLKHNTLVVDGQQRLSTIYSYIQKDPKLKLKRIKSFDELSETERTNFLYYTIVVRDLKNITKDEIKEVFSRINSVSYALNAMEIDNALYDGEYISTAKLIADEMGKSTFPFFAGNDVSRMKDIEYVLTIMTTLEIGSYFSNRKEVKDLIRQNDNEYPNKDKRLKNFKMVISLLEKIDEKLKFDSLWYSKSGLFTLLTELLFVLDKKHQLPSLEKIIEVLCEIDKEVRKENPSEEYEQFYYYCCQATASKQARISRGELLRKKLK